MSTLERLKVIAMDWPYNSGPSCEVLLHDLQRISIHLLYI